MKTDRILVERRSYRRFYIEGRAICNDLSVGGHIVDLSRGGLAFRYIEGPEPLQDGGVGAIAGRGFFLENLPLQTVSEYDIDNGIYIIKRRGIRFGDLTPDQVYELEKLITEFTQAD